MPSSLAREYIEYVPATRKVDAAPGCGRERAVRRARTLRSRVSFSSAPTSSATSGRCIAGRWAATRRSRRSAKCSRRTAWTSRASRSTRRAATSTPRSTTAAIRASRVLDAKTYAPVALPLPANAEHVVAGWTSLDGRYVTIGVATPQAPRVSYVWDWQRKAIDAVGRAVGAGDRPRQVRARQAHVVPRQGRHPDPDVRALSRGLCAGREPGRGSVSRHRGLSRRTGSAGEAGLLAVSPDVRQCGLYPGRAQRARQRRLRQAVARRRQRAEAPRRHRRHRGCGPLRCARSSRATARRRGSV